MDAETEPSRRRGSQTRPSHESRCANELPEGTVKKELFARVMDSGAYPLLLSHCAGLLVMDNRIKGVAIASKFGTFIMEADANCTSPSISADGSRIAFISSASNLADNGNGQPQLLVFKREAPSLTLELKRGWNLCGTPLTLDEQSVELLKSEPACWGWSNGRFHLMESFQAGQGFWLYALEDKILRLTGEDVDPTPLRHGWNLVRTFMAVQPRKRYR